MRGRKSYLKNPPPKGSGLERYVDYMNSFKDDRLPEEKSQQTQDFEAMDLLRREPRIWKLPHQVVRDYPVRGGLVAIYGEARANLLFDHFPELVNEYTAFLMDDAYRNSTAEERKPPKQTQEDLIVLIVFAAFMDATVKEPNETINHYCEEVAKHLGVSRGFVYRFMRGRLSRVGNDERARNLAHVWEFISQLMRECDAEHRAKLCPLPRSRKAGRNEHRTPT